MVTPTLTSVSVLKEVIFLTISEGLCRSISHLWIIVWNRAQVLEPSPLGVFLVVILRVLGGIQTGPFTLRFFSFMLLIRSALPSQRLHIEAGEGGPTGINIWASWWLSGKETTHNAGDVSWVPGLGRSPGEGNGNPFQYSCQRNPTDRGA